MSKQDRMVPTKHSTQEVRYPRTRRTDDIRNITSLPAGKVVPLAIVPLLLEDEVRSSRLRTSFRMEPTVEVLVNPVKVDVHAYLVPNTALDRFASLDAMHRSYQKKEHEGGAVTPFIVEDTYGATPTEFQKYAGLHGNSGDKVNGTWREVYNTVWNFMAGNTSQGITLRDLDDETLAPAFLDQSRFRNIVPSFDEARMEGEVALNVTSAKMPVQGLGRWATGPGAGTSQSVKTYGGVTENLTGWLTSAAHFFMKEDPDNIGFPDVFTEMEANGITVSLANIEAARKTQAFARLKARYSAYDDDYIVDFLMQGVSIPDQAYRQPILLSRKSTIFGMSQRYATDSVDMTATSVNGATFVDMTIAVPRLPMGGNIIVVAQVTPEPLFERGIDTYFHTTDQVDFPNALRDTLDRQKVDAVSNKQIDNDHADPDGTFGFWPMNAEYFRAGPKIGGDYFRPDVDAGFDEKRQSFWAFEEADPTLTENWYIAADGIHLKPFASDTYDPFQAMTQGLIKIVGNTQFGDALIEASTDYDDVLAEAPTDQIEQ